jgi:methionyl-tRNA formyltransferase
MLRVVFMGSPEDVVAPLGHLLKHGRDAGFLLVAAVSQPARPVGRGGALQDPPVAAFAKQHDLLCLQPESAKSTEFLQELRSLSPDVIVTAAYGQILSDDFLKIPRLGTINIHPSRLPKYRGATPVPAALLDGLEYTAVTILFTVKKLDAGNIILQRDFAIESHETAGMLTRRLFAASGELLMEALRIISSDVAYQGVAQNDADATFCKKIEKDMGLINWGLNSAVIVNRFRAFEPWPGSWTFLGDKRLVITEMDLCLTHDGELRRAGSFGYDKAKKSLVVKCGKGLVCVRRLKPAGGKEMDAGSFWNGLKDKSETSFVMTSDHIKDPIG